MTIFAYVIIVLLIVALIMLVIDQVIERRRKQTDLEDFSELSFENGNLEERLRCQQGLIDALEEALDAERKG